MIKLKKYKDKKSGKRYVEVTDLSFLSDRERFNWLSRHYYHWRHKRAFKKADKVIVRNENLAYEVVKYYFVPKYKVYQK
jgi:hypothetical protein